MEQKKEKNKITIHPSISVELEATLRKLSEEKTELNGGIAYKEFRNFSQVVEYLLIEGLKAFKKIRDRDEKVL